VLQGRDAVRSDVLFLVQARSNLSLYSAETGRQPFGMWSCATERVRKRESAIHARDIVPRSLLRRGCRRKTQPQVTPYNLKDSALLDHLVGQTEQRQRDSDAEGLGSLNVNDQLEFCCLLNRQISGVLALGYAADVTAG
jgi:hypothetical protein